MEESEKRGMSRRKFISGIALTGVGLAFGKVLNAADTFGGTVGGSAKTVGGGNTAAPSSLPKRRLGNLEVSAIGLGCMSMNSGNYNPPRTAKEMAPVIAAAVERGITLFDTAEAYGPFINEELVGETIRPYRDKIAIATKFGWDIDYATGRHTGGLNSRPEHIRRVVDMSLKRLKTDRIDLLYQHRVDPEVPIEDVAGTIKDLMTQGKVLNWGLSEPGWGTLRRAHAECPVAAVQNEYSLMTRDPEKGIIDICEELGIALVAWSPLGVGFLAGTIDENTRFDAPGYTDYRLSNPRFTPEARRANRPLVDFLLEWGARKNATPAQLSLAWLLAKKPFVIPIPGTTRIPHLEEDLGAFNVSFSAEELTKFDRALNGIKIHGKRLNPRLMVLSEVEAAVKE